MRPSNSLVRIDATAAAAWAVLLVLTTALAAAAEGRSPATAVAVLPTHPAAPAAIALPWLTLVYRADCAVELHGTVPNDMERAAILHHAHSLYGGDRVAAHLTAQAVANPSWLNPAFLPDLRGLHHGQVDLRDGQLEVDGEAPDEATRAGLACALAGLAAQGLKVVNRVALRQR